MHLLWQFVQQKTSLISVISWFVLILIKITLFLLDFFCQLQCLKPF